MQTPGQPWFSRLSRLAAFFGLKRNLVILLIAIFVIGAGEELWMRFVPKYLQALGATVFVSAFMMRCALCSVQFTPIPAA